MTNKKFTFNKVAGSKNEFIHTYFSRFLLNLEMTFGRTVSVNQNYC